MKRGLPTPVWILLGLLGLSAFMLSLGQRDLIANPTIESYGPSGMSAFAQLLSRAGYRVELDRRPNPRLGPNDLAVAFTELNPDRPLAATEALQATDEALRKHAEKGGKVLVINIPSRFQDASRRLLRSKPQIVQDLGRGRRFEVNASPTQESGAGIEVAEVGDPSVRLWTIGETDYLRATKVDEGTVFTLSDGMPLSNRFLDRGDNAAAAIAAVELLAPKGGRVVFTEAAFGNARAPGLLESLGTWALASWYQVLFLAVVVVYTLGRPFGIPESERPKQRGARELLDAIADTYLRGQQSRVALRTTLARVDADLRAALRLPRDAELDARDERLSPELRKAMANAYAALRQERLPQSDTLPIVRELLKAKNEFLGRKR